MHACGIPNSALIDCTLHADTAPLHTTHKQLHRCTMHTNRLQQQLTQPEQPRHLRREGTPPALLPVTPAQPWRLQPIVPWLMADEGAVGLRKHRFTRKQRQKGSTLGTCIFCIPAGCSPLMLALVWPNTALSMPHARTGWQAIKRRPGKDATAKAMLTAAQLYHTHSAASWRCRELLSATTPGVLAWLALHCSRQTGDASQQHDDTMRMLAVQHCRVVEPI